MKRKEFKTSQGEFIIIDKDGNGRLIHPNCEYIEFGRLSEITEDQAKEIVDEPEYTPCNNCLNGCPVCGGYGYSISFINELHSLIKSLGIHLYKNPEGVTYSKMSDSGSDYRSFLSWQEAESITFYNPYIFKKLNK